MQKLLWNILYFYRFHCVQKIGSKGKSWPRRWHRTTRFGACGVSSRRVDLRGRYIVARHQKFRKSRVLFGPFSIRRHVCAAYSCSHFGRREQRHNIFHQTQLGQTFRSGSLVRSSCTMLFLAGHMFWKRYDVRFLQQISSSNLQVWLCNIKVDMLNNLLNVTEML